MFKPVKSGFTCHDRSLSLPYIDPNHEVIPLLMLLSLAFAGPAITVRSNNNTDNDFILLIVLFRFKPNVPLLEVIYLLTRVESDMHKKQLYKLIHMV